MMLNIIVSSNELLFATINALQKVSATSRINFAKTPFWSLMFSRVPKILIILGWLGGAIFSHNAQNLWGTLECFWKFVDIIFCLFVNGKV